jgi:hypothetical protein
MFKNHKLDSPSITSFEEIALREIMQRDRAVLAARQQRPDFEEQQRRASISATLKGKPKSSTRAVPRPLHRRTTHA